jgi:regulator of replication initiation timing
MNENITRLPCETELMMVYEKLAALQSRLTKVEEENIRLGVEVAKLREAWDKVAFLVPRRPNAITWEHGVKILNLLQETVEAIDKAALAKGV